MINFYSFLYIQTDNTGTSCARKIASPSFVPSPLYAKRGGLAQDYASPHHWEIYFPQLDVMACYCL